jgi:biotin carboxyl carrier protein
MADTHGAVEPSPSPPGAGQSALLPALDLKRLNRQLAALAQRPTASPETLRDALKLAVTLVNAGAAGLFDAAAGGVRLREQLLSRQAQAWDDDLPGRMAACAIRCMQEDSLQIQRLPGLPQAAIFAVPLPPPPGDASPRAALCLAILLGDQPPEVFAASLQLFAALLGVWLNPGASQPAAATGPPAALALVAGVLAQPDAAAARRELVEGLRRLLASDRVVLGIAGAGGRVRPMAASGWEAPGAEGQIRQALEQALTESALLNRATAWPEGEADEFFASPLLAELARNLKAERALCVPIHDGRGRLRGAVLLLSSAAHGHPVGAQLRRVADLLPALGGCLYASRPLIRRLWDDATPGRAMGRGRRWLLLASGLLLAAVLSVLPVEFSVTGPSLIQPAARRWVAAPFDGLLDKVLFKPGNDVRQGDLLARMDGREIELELGSVLADLGKAAKLRDVQLAAGSAAEAQIAALDKERLEQRLELLQRRKGQLELRSPIDGIVLSGDLERVEGAAVTKGKLLCEIAPLEVMRVEIAVAQEDVRYLREGMNAHIDLEAHPGRAWQAPIRSIWPKSEIREERSVFIAEVESDNPQGMLRPGMKGRARIPIARRALAWVVFHRPWERLMASLGG